MNFGINDMDKDNLALQAKIGQSTSNIIGALTALISQLQAEIKGLSNRGYTLSTIMDVISKKSIASTKWHLL